jgi:hypothetical protein
MLTESFYVRIKEGKFSKGRFDSTKPYKVVGWRVEMREEPGISGLRSEHDSFLLVDDEKEFLWVPVRDCTFAYHEKAPQTPL